MAKKSKQNIKLDSSLEKHYSLGKEKDRLLNAPSEKDRTLKILKKNMPPPPKTIFDIGGAYGVYAFPLAEQGYEVHLIDPIAKHIELAHSYASHYPSIKLASISIGDARKIEYPDQSADIILLFGPLYHLIQAKERQLALNEAYRLLKPGGILFATIISRYQSFIDKMHKGEFNTKIEKIKKAVIEGIHESENSNMNLYFHHPLEFKEELKGCKFDKIRILSIEGPVWHEDIMLTLKNDPLKWQQFINFLEVLEEDETIVGSSAHIMGIARKT